ncbi:MAG: succinylglutamate desuccinylase [Proteobacteria bacterium]|nr:MAG: succinylglutamate desuccinylase [Pseudomonadota bacterium]QKK11096.1 MAG: succinylglutamate desuccinylase/aspartoacylase family protein [Pseudomonadota bacterium]
MAKAGSGFTIAGREIKRGSRETIELPLPHLFTHSPVAMPVHVVCGRRDGPRLFVCAAVHGDEINGVEIIRRLVKTPILRSLRGTLVAIPVVNVHGFISHSRYLPDRRDLNRSFPGSESGSLAGRLARLFLSEIVEKCTHGVDLHTGAGHRTNLSQIRANLDDPETLKLARAFGAPVLINANLRDGSLRQAAAELGIPTLLFETGEALRFDEISIRAGERGILNVMRILEMLPAGKRRRAAPEPVVARATSWVRAPISGVLRMLVPPGGRISKDGLLAVVADPFGEREAEVRAPFEGIVIGRTNLPLANEGDALFHLARFRRLDEVAGSVEEFHETLWPETPDETHAEGPIL